MLAAIRLDDAKSSPMRPWDLPRLKFEAVGASDTVLIIIP